MTSTSFSTRRKHVIGSENNEVAFAGLLRYRTMLSPPAAGVCHRHMPACSPSTSYAPCVPAYGVPFTSSKSNTNLRRHRSTCTVKAVDSSGSKGWPTWKAAALGVGAATVLSLGVCNVLGESYFGFRCMSGLGLLHSPVL